MNPKNLLPLFLFFAFHFLSLSAQLTPISTDYFSYKKGLPNRIAYDIFQDKRGMLWVSTDVGISMFNGKTFYNFSNIGYSNLTPKINIRGAGTFSEDRYNNLIIKPIEDKPHLEIFNYHSLYSTKIPLINNKNIKGEVLEVFINPLDHCYILSKSENGFLIYRMLSDYSFELHSTCPNFGQPPNNPTHFIFNSPKDFWYFDYHSQKIFNHTNGKVQDFPIPSEDTISTNLGIFHLDKKGDLWFSSSKDKEIFRIQKGEQKIEKIPLLDKKYFATKVWEDQQGNLIFSDGENNYATFMALFSSEGVVTDFSNILKLESKISNLESNNFLEYFYISSFNGVHKVKFATNHISIKSFLNKKLSAGKFGEIMRGMVADNSGKIYTNSEQGRWYMIDTSNWQLTTLPIKDSQGNLMLDRECSTNLIYDGTYIWGTSCHGRKEGNIHRYDVKNGTWEAFPLPSPKQYARGIIKKSEYEFWILTIEWQPKQSDILVLNTLTKEITPYRKIKDKTFPILDQEFLNFFKDPDGKIWLASNYGLVEFDPSKETWIPHQINQELKDYNKVSAIHRLNKDSLLIGTYEQGLFVFNQRTQQFSKFSMNDNRQGNNYNLLPNNFVAGIIPVEKNNLLVTTFNGFAYLDFKNKQVIEYASENGFSNGEYNRYAHYVDKGKNIYLGGVNGFDIFKMQGLKNLRELRQPIISSFYQVNSQSTKKETQFKPIDHSQPLTIHHNIIQFGFDFFLPEYYDNENIVYQTQLEGWEENFREPTKINNLSYYKLPAGNYVLNIKARDGLGNTTDKILSIPIQVQQVFYKQPWFIITGLLILLGSIVAYGWRKLQQLQQEERKEKERLLIQQRFTELELKTVRLQLNPHFMFNALGAIQNFIDQNNKKLAIGYLADFALLMRMFLESSKKRYISLAEEMRLIQLYVSLEKMRFDHKFDVEYFVDPSIDQNFVELPSLLLQPFVENAINHGLYHKKEKGLLSISVNSRKENHLEFIIQDDGIGRTRAAEIKKQSLRKHKSRGTEIIKERLETLNSTGEVRIELSTMDAFKEQKDCGTRVVISIVDLE